MSNKDDLIKAIAQKEKELEELQQQWADSWPKRVVTFLHSNGECMAEKGKLIGLQCQAIEKFSFALYEVKITLEVDEDGSWKIVKVEE